MNSFNNGLTHNNFVSDRRQAHAMTEGILAYSKLAKQAQQQQQQQQPASNNDAASTFSQASTVSLLKSKFRKSSRPAPKLSREEELRRTLRSTVRISV